MAARTAVRRGSTGRAGRVVPATARWLKARVVRLGPGQSMAWHSTQDREELLIALEGSVVVEIGEVEAVRRVPLAAGQTLFLPSRTPHGVRHASGRAARYLYVTGGHARRGSA